MSLSSTTQNAASPRASRRARARMAGITKTLAKIVRDPIGALGLILVAIILITAVFADFLMPYDPNKIDVLNKLAGPSADHWLGTDNLGRDTFSRVIIGTRIAMQVAVISIGIAMVGGIVLGLLAGYGPKWLDSCLVLVFDSMSSLPMIMFAMAVITVLGTGTFTLILVIVAVSVPGYARMIRAQTLALKNSEFVLAERSLNASSARIIFTHLLPNVVGSLVILASMDMPVVIMPGGRPELPGAWHQAARCQLGHDPQ